MTEQEMLAKMVAPGQRRPQKWGEGVLQILVTSTCNLACFNCTQASNVRRPGKPWFMTPEQFEQAVKSLGFTEQSTFRAVPLPVCNPEAYFGVVGVFGGNPAVSPHFREYCAILRRYVPFHQRGLWCNDPMSDDLAKEMRATFNPAVSNLNVHLSHDAFNMFKRNWPEANVFGQDRDSRHSPPWVAMKDVLRVKCPKCNGLGDRPLAKMDEEGYTHVVCSQCDETGTIPDDDRIRELVSNCDINQHWSALIGVFRGQLRAWFCEIAGAQSILHQDDLDYPDTGLDPTRLYDAFEEPTGGLLKQVQWWRLPMGSFTGQVRKHCWDCGIPLRGYGELACAKEIPPEHRSSPDHGNPREQVSATHADVYRPKKSGRRVEVVTDLVQLEIGRIQEATKYLQNGSK